MPTAPLGQYYDAAMTAGDDFREQVDQGDALAVLGVRYIQSQLRTKFGSPTKPAPRTAYILRSLKHQEEVMTLRQIYGGSFFLIGAYAPKAQRTENLARRLAGVQSTPAPANALEESVRLIERDENESGKRFGQQARDTFSLSDIFIDTTASIDDVRRNIRRFIELVCGYPFHTPTRHEFGMFHAHAAALRSSAMGRQVGASVCNDDGDLVCVGANEVPKAFGGLYWGDEDSDKRDFQLGVDSNDEIKNANVNEVVRRLIDGGWLRDDRAATKIEDLTEQAKKLFKGTRIMNPLEFGRTVHAEMAAIVGAARLGIPIQNELLYVTTFPCHECARHIIASGLKEVHYIEPYPKSLAGALHDDSIAIEEEPGPKRVSFQPFVGVAPRQYFNLFSMKPRKDGSGRRLQWDGHNAMPLNTLPHEAYIEAENVAAYKLFQRIKKVQLNLFEETGK